MDLNLKGKTALITGGSRGIGRAVAQTLASAGCNLVLTSRNADDLARAKADIEAKPNVKVRIFAGDLAKGATVEQLAKAKTLYLARFDDEILEQIKTSIPELVGT